MNAARSMLLTVAVEIGKLPEPGKTLAAAVEEVRRSIEQQDPTPQRQSWVQTLAQMSTLASNAPEVAQRILDAVGRIPS